MGPTLSRRHPIHRRLAYYYDKYMVCITLMASIIVYLQAAVIQSNQSSENVSLASFILWLIVSTSVLLYGVIWDRPLLITSSLIATVGSVWAIVTTISYRPAAGHGAFAL